MFVANIDELLRYNNDVQVRIVFTANNTHDDKGTPIERHLTASNNLNDKTIIRRVLHNWYEQKQKNYESWARIYPVELEKTEYFKTDKQYAWCQLAEVTATPTLLLNSRRLPQIYPHPI